MLRSQSWKDLQVYSAERKASVTGGEYEASMFKEQQEGGFG